MQDKTEILKPGSFYHIYNRACGKEKLFTGCDNYYFFLEKYKQYILPICNTYAYCLMPNHFHFLIQIKDKNEILAHLNLQSSLNLTGFENLSGLLSKQFSHFFNSYTKAFNKQEGRKGGLFIRPFKRKKITNVQYLYKTIHYIHFNPVMAGLCRNPNDWYFSSYNTLFTNKKTNLKRKEVMEWFDGKENFIYAHQCSPPKKQVEILQAA